MKDTFDRYQDRLAPEEKAELWDEIAARAPGQTLDSSTTADDPAGLDRARRAVRTSQWWRRPWGWSIAATLAAAAVLAVALHRGAPVFERPDVAHLKALEPSITRQMLNGPREESNDALAAKPEGTVEVDLPSAPPAEPPAAKQKSPAAPGGEEGQASVTAPVIDASRAAAGAAASRDLAAQSNVLTKKVESIGGVIEGTVTDTTGAPLAYANVVLLGTSWGTMTDVRGHYRIERIPAGSYTLTAMLLGFEPASDDSVAIGGDLAAALDFRLHEKPLGTLPEVEVTAAREVIQKRLTSTSHSISSKDLESLPVNEISEAIGLKSGVIAKGEEIHFRGGRSGDVKYQVDGLAVRDPLAGGGGSTADASGSASPSEGKIERDTWGGVKSKQVVAKKAIPAEQGRSLSVPVGGAQPPAAAPVPPAPSVNIYGGTTLPNDEKVDAMFFQHAGVNPLIPTEEDRFSTFAVDVDNAAYTMARLYLQQGSLPPEEAVRVEECVNFFKQDYPTVRDDDFRIFMDAAPAPFADGYQLLRVGIAARAIDPAERKPADLVFVVDVSGSMQREDRLEAVKQALGYLLDHLREGDRVAIVAFGTTASVILQPTDASDRSTIRRGIDALYSNGSTNAEQGLNLGYDLARQMRREGRITRILLCSDGVANVGATGPESILSRIREEADKGIQLSTIGFGMGNYNDILMERLADDGDGGYYYVDNLKEAQRVFVENLTGTLQTLGRDAKIQVEFDPKQVQYYRLLGFENRDVKDEDFRNDAIDAGEIGAGHVVTALYELKLDNGAHWGPIATVRFRYDRPDSPAGQPDVREIASTFDVQDLAPSFERASARLRLDAAVAEYAEILRHSFYAKEGSFEQVLPIARDCARDLPGDEHVAEFVTLVEKARGLWKTRPTPEPGGPPAVNR
ncbi:MAG: von Willebrand factor type A domain-containing protein [Candidatus Eisenbacteria bacterium]